MAYEAKNGDISVFKNHKKEKDTHPDYTGKALLEGETHYVSLWIKKRENGEAFFSGQIQKKQEKSSAPVDDPLNQPTAVELGPLEDDSLAPVDTSKKKPPAPVDDGLPF
jgi:hypothetical protein